MMYRILIICLIIVTVSISVPTRAETVCSFTVGVVPQFEQRRIFEVWDSVLKSLERETGCTFELIGSGTIAEFEQSFLSGVYDFAYMNPYHAVMAKQAQGYEPIIRSGTKKLRGILVVKKDTPISNISDLNGQPIAFPSPNALGASLLMRAELARDYNVHAKPKYVKTHSSVYLHVAKGLVSAGGGVARTLNEQPAYIQNAVRILHTTTPVNAHPFVVHPRVDMSYSNKIQSAWLSLAVSQPDLFDGIPMKGSVASSYRDYQILETFGLDNFAGK